MLSPFLFSRRPVNDQIDGRSTAFSSRRGGRCGVILSCALLAACQRGPITEEDRLRAALAAFRPGEGRLVGAPWIEINPAALYTQLPESPREPITRSAGSEPDPSLTAAALRMAALSNLLAGRVDDAVAGLSRAAALSPNASLWSDLAAAHLQRASTARDSYEIVLALAAADRAVRLDPTLQAARFNRALALGRLSLRSGAEAEWRILLPLEKDPLWAREGRERAQALASATAPGGWQHDLQRLEDAAARHDLKGVKTLVARSPQRFREHAEEALLGSWAEAVATGSSAEAARSLSIARPIGIALAAHGGDRMVADTVAQIDLLETLESVRQRALIEGLRAYQKGVSLSAEQTDFAGALPRFLAARRALAVANSPFERWAAFKIALCHYHHSRLGQAFELLKALNRDPEHGKYIAVHGRSLWLLGLIDLIEGRPTVSLDAFGSALSDFERLREPAHVARLRSLQAEALENLGQTAEAWRWLYPALIEPKSQDQPALRHAIFQMAAWLALKQGETETARWFQDEVVRQALSTGQAYRIAGALRGRGTILTALGKSTQARNDLAQARRFLTRVFDSGTHQTLDEDLKMAEMALATSPHEAVALLDEVIPSFRSSSYHYRLAQAFFARAQASMQLGLYQEAENDLAAALSEYEEQREQIVDIDDRIAYFDRARQPLDAMLLLQLNQRERSDVAFQYSEQAKSRALFDWIISHPAKRSAGTRLPKLDAVRSDLETLQQGLPSSTVVVEYAVLPQSIIIWAITENSFAVKQVDLSSAELDEIVNRFRRDLEGRRTIDLRRISSHLYDILVAPIEPHIAAGDRVVVVPDRILHSLPFPVLFNGRTRRYFVQDHVLSVAPSARLLVASLQRDTTPAAPRSPRVLAIADPDFDRNLFPLLQRLSADPKELPLTRLFPGSKLLQDRDATQSAFLRGAGDFEIVHFGGHSIVNSDYPLLSQMVFSSDASDPTRGVLTAEKLLGHRFERTRLVVLASCSTAAGKVSSTEGAQSLARPFLAVGVPAVVAALWEVEDATTGEFFGRFYHHLQQSLDPALALQLTQIESVTSRSRVRASPKSWGGFELIGGNAFPRQSP